MPHRILTTLLLAAPLLLLGCGGGGGSSSTAVAGGSSASGVGTVVAMAAGAGHTAVAMAAVGAASGPVAVWGDNTWGQIGDGTLVTPKPAPVALKTSTLPATTAWKSIAAGEAHSLAIRSTGTLWAWGRNDNGQLGDGITSIGRSVPIQIGSAADWTAVAAGDAHSLALGGTSLFAWGRNAEGQLGQGSTTGTGGSLVQVINKTEYLAPTKLTRAYVTGVAGAPSTLPFTGKTWTAISAGGKFAMALRSDGVVFSWGSDTLGQLGQLGLALNYSIPTQIAPVGSGTLPVIAIAAGQDHALCILSDHTLYAWGANQFGQLGSVALITHPTVAPVQVGIDTNWFVVAAGGAHTLAIKQDQSLWAWGSNSEGQLGDGTTTDALAGPIPIATGKRWLSVAAGRYHSLAIDTDGKLWVWGRNAEGQLGLGSGVGSKLEPTLVP